MPIKILSTQQLNKPTADMILAKLQDVLGILSPLSRNLTPEERQKYGSINEDNKLIVGKDNDYHLKQPALQSPDVDWDAFDASFYSRTALEAIESLCASIIETSSDFRILHDHDLYQSTLADYDYSKYKAESTEASGGYTTKVEELKQFFPNPSGNASKKETPAAPTA